MPLSIRLTDDERQLVDSYAKIHSISVAEAFKRPCLKKLRMNLMLL